MRAAISIAAIFEAGLLPAAVAVGMFAAGGCSGPRRSPEAALFPPPQREPRAAIEAAAHYGQGFLLVLEARRAETNHDAEEAQRRWARAAEQFERCLLRDPGAPHAARSLALCALRVKDKDLQRRAAEALASVETGDAATRRALAWMHVQANRGQDALREFQAALARYDPSDPERTACLLDLAGLLRAMNRADEAVTLLQAEADSGRADGAAHLCLAETLVASGRSQEAICAARRRIDGLARIEDGPDARLLGLLVQESVKNGKADEGVEALRVWRQRWPDEWACAESMARLLQAASRPADAVAHTRAFSQAHPSQVAPRLLLADLLESQGDVPGALAALRELAADQRMTSESLRRFVASRLAEMGERAARDEQPGRAAEAYQAAMSLDKDLVPAARRELRLRTVSTLIAARRLEPAGEALKPLLEVNPPDPQALLLRARLLWCSDLRAEAVDACRQGLERFGKQAAVATEFHRTLSSFYVLLGRSREGEEELRHALRLRPGDADACNDLGYFLASQGRDLDEAVRLIKAALAERPDEPAFLDSLGWAYYKLALRLDDVDLAKAAHGMLEQAASARRDAVILHHLGDANFVLGRWQAAADAWARSLQKEGEPDAESRPEACEKKLQALRSQLSEDPSTATRAIRRPLEPPERQLPGAASSAPGGEKAGGAGQSVETKTDKSH